MAIWIGLAGLNASGKGEVVGHLERWSFHSVSLSDVIRDGEETWDIRFRVLGDFIEVSDARAPRTKTGPLFSDALRNILDRRRCNMAECCYLDG